MRTTRLWALPCLMIAATGCDNDDTDLGVGPDGGAGTAGTGGGGSGGTMGMGGGGQGGGGRAGSAGGMLDGGLGGSGPDAGNGSNVSTVSLELVTSGLVSPVAMVEVPDGSGRFLIADRVGTVHVLGADGQLGAEPFLDISAALVPLSDNYDERGLLGMTLHPDYAENGRFFVYYSAPLRAGAPAGYDHTSNISEFQVSNADPDAADPTERIVLQVDQPQSNHNGGQIVFGPDGYLYIPLGDGGAADDVGLGHVEDWYEVNEGGNGQDLEQSLLGKILRIDVDAGEPYAIPEDNPFAGSAMPEIWAYGFRNPYRIAFDRGGSQQLFAGDVGQNLWEEVDIVTAGGNYGWNVKEGTRCFSTANPNEPLSTCPSEDPDGVPLVDPILEYPHSGEPGDIFGLSVIGGHVYRGSAIPGLEGRYVFGDWSTSFGAADGLLVAATPPEGGGGAWSMAPLTIADRDSGRLGEYVLSFGEDAAGELYVLTSDTGGPSGTTGRVYRLAP